MAKAYAMSPEYKAAVDEAIRRIRANPGIIGMSASQSKHSNFEGGYAVFASTSTGWLTQTSKSVKALVGGTTNMVTATGSAFDVFNPFGTLAFPLTTSMRLAWWDVGWGPQMINLDCT